MSPVRRADEGWLERIAAEPALVQLVLLAVLGGVAWWVVVRLGRVAREARSRKALRDQLLGIELLLSRDPAAALRRLVRAVSGNPDDAGARLAQALALGDLGRSTEAHRAHVELRTGLDEQSFPNDLGLARALLDAGHGSDALDAAERAVRARPADTGALDVLVRAATAAGWPDRAARAAIELGRRTASPVDRARYFARAEELTERAALTAIRERRLDDARQMAATLRSVVGDSAAVRELGLVLDLASGRDLPVSADALPLIAAVEHGATGLLGELDSAARAVDAIEANEAHVDRLCERWMAGEAEVEDELLELRDRAVSALLRRLPEMPPEDDRATRLLRRFGVDALPAVLDAIADAGTRKGIGSAARRERMSRGLRGVVLGSGPEALPLLEARLQAANRDERKVLIDWFVTHGDPRSFESVVEACAPVELLHRLNEVESDALVRLLRELPEGHVVLDVLLAEPAFERDAELLAAIPGARAPAILESLVVRRGLTRAALRALVAHIANPALIDVVERVLRAFGDRALPFLVSTYADLDRSAEQRRAIAKTLDRAGAGVVPLLCDGFGSTPAPLDTDIVERLCAVGEAGVDALLEAYRKGGLVERLAGPLARRRTHRRERILQALGAIGGRRARLALGELQREESDADLRLRIAQRIHALESAPRARRLDHPSLGAEEDHGRTG